MEYRQIAGAGISASVLGFGMWPMGGTQHAGGRAPFLPGEAVDATRRALDLGVTLFDTHPPMEMGLAGMRTPAEVEIDRQKV